MSFAYQTRRKYRNVVLIPEIYLSLFNSLIKFKKGNPIETLLKGKYFFKLNF